LKFDYPDAYASIKGFLDNLKLNRPLPPLPDPSSDREKYFLAGRNIYQAYYDIAGLETRLSKFSIVAPFNGVVTLSTVKPGTLVRAGQKLGEFIDASVFELAADIDVNDCSLIKIGDRVELASTTVEPASDAEESVTDSSGETLIGHVVRVGSAIDSNTQSLKIYVEVKNPGGQPLSQRLKEGMYLKGYVLGNQFLGAAEISRKLLPEKNKVLVIRDNRVHLVAVDVLRYNRNSVIVKGLTNGTLLPEKIAGLSEGMIVRPVKNDETIN